MTTMAEVYGTVAWVTISPIAAFFLFGPASVVFVLFGGIVSYVGIKGTLEGSF